MTVMGKLSNNWQIYEHENKKDQLSGIHRSRETTGHPYGWPAVAAIQ
jgi:hypothetical protein